jgi:CheY-like chemotaxis protein
MQVLDVENARTALSPPFGQRVLFVDDEPHLLAALRRMLRSERERWDMRFASSGAEALALMDVEPVDAIVSDMRMPGMDGAALLARVQRDYPSTARIILSGQADLGSVIAVLKSAQQFLAKPCEAPVLIGAVDGALRMQRLLNDPALRELIGGVASLPTMPTIYHDVVAALDAPEVDVPALAKLLGSDVATSAELLKLVNSAFFGLPREVSSVESAVEGWSAQERGLAVLSCMLRDVGGLVLAEARPDAAHRLTELAVTEGPIDPIRQAELEIEAYGCTVPRASAYLLGLWGFAPAVIHTVVGYPLVTPGPGTSLFEHALRFAGLRVLDPFSAVHVEPDDYLTAERLAAWNRAADAVIVQ